MDRESIAAGWTGGYGLKSLRKKWRHKMGSVEKGITELKLYSPLSGRFFDSEDCGRALNRITLSGYKREIQDALGKDEILQSEKGLAEYIQPPSLKERIISMHPGVEVWSYGMWSVLTVKCRGALSGGELETLKDEWHGQMTDGWGESFSQEAVDCDEGCCLYVDYVDTKRSSIKTEQELKGITEEQEMPGDTGMQRAAGSTQTMG
jgi:hypothetical protein